MSNLIRRDRKWKRRDVNRRFLAAKNAVVLIVVKLREQDEQHVKELEELRLWLSLVQNQVKLSAFAEGVDQDEIKSSSVRTVLIATHVDKYRGGKSALQMWSDRTCEQLRRAYPLAGVVDMLLLNASNESETRAAVWPLVLNVSQAQLKGKTTPQFMEDLHAAWQAVRESVAPWMRHADAIKLLADRGLAKSEVAAVFAIDALLEMGDVLRIGDVVVLNPAWLSMAVSSIVLPSDEEFQGIAEGSVSEGKMDNGVVSATTLLSFLDNVKLPGESKRARPTPLCSTPQDAEQLLEWLQWLDVCFPLDSQTMFQTTSNSKQDLANQVGTQFVIPARMVCVISSLWLTVC